MRATSLPLLSVIFYACIHNNKPFFPYLFRLIFHNNGYVPRREWHASLYWTNSLMRVCGEISQAPNVGHKQRRQEQFVPNADPSRPRKMSGCKILSSSWNIIVYFSWPLSYAFAVSRPIHCPFARISFAFRFCNLHFIPFFCFSCLQVLLHLHFLSSLYSYSCSSSSYFSPTSSFPSSPSFTKMVT